MIRVEIDLRRWLQLHPELEIEENECQECGAVLRSTIPVVSPDYFGLTSPPCECGDTRSGCECMVTRSAKEQASWAAILG